MILNDFKLIIWAKTVEIISKLSRRDTIIDNCQLSIVNSAKPLNDHLSYISKPQLNRYLI